MPIARWHNSGWNNCPAREVAARFAVGKATDAEVAQFAGIDGDGVGHFVWFPARR